MNSKVVVVTPPDDILEDGFRIIAVDLTLEQSQILSNSLLNVNYLNTVILYSWNNQDSIEWVLDKKHKSDLIIFNAESENQILVGHLAGQKNSYFFGKLKTLDLLYKNDIYSYEDCYNLLNKYFEKYE